MIEKFLNKEDIYVFTGKLYKNDPLWNHPETPEGKAFRGVWRKKFKQVFLSILYGTGISSLADNLNCSVDEAKNVIDMVFKTFPKLREYIDKQKKYPFTHNGEVATFFGDVLKSPDYKYLYKNGKIDNAVKARIERHAVNLPIQGGTSVCMTGSFYNVMRAAKKEGFCIRSIITVNLGRLVK